MLTAWLEQFSMLRAEFFMNSLAAYMSAGATFVVLLVIFKGLHVLIVRYAERWTRRTATDMDDTLLRIVTSVRPAAYFSLALYFAVRTLELTPMVTRVVNVLLLAVFVYQAVLSLQILIDYMVRRRLRRAAKTADQVQGATAADDQNLEAALGLVNKISMIALWAVGILFLLSNAGINVTSLLASLGIGGIAVALALQNVLGDLFSSLAIYMDKPFTIGDFIIVGDVKGTVKQIGIKTTRLKSLDGEEIILSNRELTSARVSNYARMQERRIAFKFGVLYETAVDQVREVPKIVEEAVSGVPNTRFSRAHFKRLGDSSLEFEGVYFVTTKSFEDYMDAQQAINLRLMEALAARGVQFAYPTQTVHLQQAA